MCRAPPKHRESSKEEEALKTTSRETLVAALILQDKATLPTKSEIRASIPAHCFEHSVFKALGHVLRDGLVIASFAWLAHTCLKTSDMGLLDVVGWFLYAFFQGSALTGWWVLAHECGHGGFSQYTALNDTVGWVLHSALLVPYFSWQYSHAKHHAKTNHLMDGESHNPNSKQDVVEAGYVTLAKTIGEEGFAGFQLVAHLLLGWPLYLVVNASGARRLYNGKPIESALLDHFRPNSKLFPPGWSTRVALSSVGILVAAAALAYASATFGLKTVALYYFYPYLWTNCWLVLYTWLQHTSPQVPHFGDDEWTWVRGALCTIDRPYAELFGWFDWMHHHIGTTHVCHHLFSNLPCYHAVEATKHLKAFLLPKGLYNYDATPTVRAAWETAKTCHYVEGTTGVQYPKHINSLFQSKQD
mmetsp:Transcript_19803/g.62352  ORF Transcript_19803/g.62352 Transcript_19803/m.62352 type:complete len:415 (-) Transcript_19803:245-1489(-)|eukprot:CAMPEP_0197394614 /NCGR_PEP_ID=MMETSP1165-20131217/5605_1 /TAXON_ID=284809 /ORGANISM="Chrysocystis fragilis, Strain CCMP3189" /LENGTH=414 /DNA_ID=CAMNT_0042920335 /DNA_START=63 /DNA_END=1307 /DNA_ORIENTATION=-